MTHAFCPMFFKFTSKQERRRRGRQLLNTSVRVLTQAGAIDAIGINISEGGMGLFTIAHLRIGDRIQVEFRTYDGPTTFLRLRGTIRHRALYLYGIEFDRGHSGEAQLGFLGDAHGSAGASA